MMSTRTTRRLVQFGFLAVTVTGVFVLRGHAERWCPLGGIEGAWTYCREGAMPCSLAVSNLAVLASVVVITLLLRRAFCGYVCPIGTLSEWLQSGARRLGLRAWRVPQRLDRVLSLLKYPVLAVILYFTWRTGELVLRGYDPCYALISRHGEDITFWTYAVTGAVIVASLLLLLPFCRWLCPLAAVLNPLSRFGLARVRRNSAACAGCAKCATACPMGIDVDRLDEVTAARCISCMRCLDVCPEKVGALSWGPPKRLGRAWPQSVLVAIVLLSITVGVAAAIAYPVPSSVQERGEAPRETAAVELRVEGLTCRGRASLLWYFLTRDDAGALAGYLRLEAWPAPAAAEARVLFDPARTDAHAVRSAIVDPYFDLDALTWRPSPFVVEGFDR